MGSGWQCEGLLSAADDGALSIIGKQHARTDKEGLGEERKGKAHVSCCTTEFILVKLVINICFLG